MRCPHSLSANSTLTHTQKKSRVLFRSRVRSVAALRGRGTRRALRVQKRHERRVPRVPVPQLQRSCARVERRQRADADQLLGPPDVVQDVREHAGPRVRRACRGGEPEQDRVHRLARQGQPCRRRLHWRGGHARRTPRLACAALVRWCHALRQAQLLASPGL